MSDAPPLIVSPDTKRENRIPPRQALTRKWPVLPGALAHLECRVVGRCPAGDHDLLIARVIGGKVHHADARPMVHIRKSGGHY